MSEGELIELRRRFSDLEATIERAHCLLKYQEEACRKAIDKGRDEVKKHKDDERFRREAKDLETVLLNVQKVRKDLKKSLVAVSEDQKRLVEQCRKVPNV